MSKSNSTKVEKSNYKGLQKMGSFLDWSGFIILLTSPITILASVGMDRIFEGISIIIAGIIIMSYGKMLIAINDIEKNTRISPETIKSDNRG